MPIEVQILNITFDLRKSPGLDYLPVPLIVARGYGKNEVVECFKKLQELGFGEYKTGSQGRGNVGKFFFNEKCPESISLDFTKKIRTSINP